MPSTATAVPNGSPASDVRSALAVLENTPAEAVLADGHAGLAALQDRFGFPDALPPAPAWPAEPQEPVLPPAPREDDAKYDVALTTLDRLLSSRRIKKQQAALNRFERDRKAWAEDRTNAMAHLEMARKRHTREVEALQAAYASSVDDWKQAFAAYLRAL